MNKSIFGWTGCALLALSACNDEATTGFGELKGEPAFAVQLSNFKDSAGIALLDGTGALLQEKYLSSGTALPGLTAALPSDIALPTTPCGDGESLTVLARFMGDFVLQVDLKESKVLAQIKTQGGSAGTAYSSNPHDILCLGDGRALVSRFAVNSGVDAANMDRGDDLVVVDLEKSQILSRVDLSAYEGEVTTFDYDTEMNVVEHTYATPDSIVRVGENHALIGLARLSVGHSANQAGTVLVLDLDSLTTKPLAIEGMANCGALFTVPGRDDAAVVQCAGSYYGNPENSGLALVSVENGEAKVDHTFKATVGSVVLNSSPTSLGGTKVIATTANYAKAEDGSSYADKAYLIDMASGSYTELFTATKPGDIGSGAVRLDTGLVLIPDVSAGVRVFELDGDKLEAKDPILLDATVPARHVRPLYQF